MDKRQLFLIGFMGAGKTAVGQLCSKKMGISFIDLDHEITKSHGGIKDIFQIKGEAAFRQYEFEHLRETCNSFESMVVSTGGGIVTYQPSFEQLHNISNVIWLKATFKTVSDRINLDKNNDRPLADHFLKKRYDDRQKRYEKVADFILSVDNFSIEEVAEKIINRYG